jgi:hypothetical protein
MSKNCIKRFRVLSTRKVDLPKRETFLEGENSPFTTVYYQEYDICPVVANGDAYTYAFLFGVDTKYSFVIFCECPYELDTYDTRWIIRIFAIFKANPVSL